MKLRQLCVVLLLAGAAVAQAAPQYKITKRAVLGGEGGWDYLTIDAQARRLYIARSNRIMVVDADSLKPVGEIRDTAGVHGVALAPKLGRGFTSNGGTNSVTIFDTKTLTPSATITVGDRPDAILFEPKSNRVFTFNARSKDTTAIDAGAGKVVATLALGGKPEFAVADGAGHVYVNIEDSAELVMFDAGKLEILHRWPLKPCEEPTGLAIDTRDKRLFSVCHNEMMAVVDGDSGKVIKTLPIGKGVDGAAFDPGNNLAISSNGGSGTMTLVRENSPTDFSVAEDVTTARGARTVVFDEKTHSFYTVTAEFEAPAAPGQRPRMKAGSFEVIVVGK